MTTYWSSLHYSHVMTTSWSPHYHSTRLLLIVSLGQVLRGLPGRLLPDFSDGGMRGGFPRLLLMKAIGRLPLDQRLSKFQWWWRERGFSLIAINESHWIPVVVAWEGVSSIAINESHWWEPRWVVSSTASWTQLKPDPRGRQHQLQPFTILLDE